MFQFSQSERIHLQKKALGSGIIGFLSKKCQAILERPLNVPQEGSADWSHYFYCPNCSIGLTFDLDKPHEHHCASCNQIFSGGFYDGAWTKLLNVFNIEGSYHLALLYLCTGEKHYAEKVVEILSAYAHYYPSYEVHGDIPYNGPGKANAQTLDESIFLRTLASAYDLVEETMTEEDKEWILTRLFSEGLAFLQEHRHQQLHNHEVICNGSIGILALLLNDKKALDLALNQKYGLRYQLEQGVLEDGFWFECSTAYHFYALQNFLSYEKFARHTPYNNLSHPLYPKMIGSVLKLLKEDLSFPLLNDTHLSQGQPNAYDLFEFAYATWREPKLLSIMQEIYANKSRMGIESFFYGVETLPKATPPIFRTTHQPKGLGLTIMRDSKEQYLLFRHGPYGGEHDHYDRLGISYSYQGEPVSEDMGTTGYGARLHYGYYKNTGTHNTVVIAEENQMPSKASILAFEQDDGHTLADAEVMFSKGYDMPDSFTILQWDEKAYLGVTMRRRLYKTEDYLIDIFEVSGVQENRSVDFVMHFGGKRVASSRKGQKVAMFSTKAPFSHLTEVRSLPGDVPIRTSYQSNNVSTDYYAMPFAGTTYLAEGPDNPSTKTIPFLIERAFSENVRFVHLLSSYTEGEKRVLGVSFEQAADTLIVKITTIKGEEQVSFPLRSNKI